MIIKELILNLSLLLSASVFANLIEITFLAKYRYKNVLLGFIFGLVAILGMTFPYVLQEGLIFDGRSIILSLATLFFGPVTGIIAGLLTFTYRLFIGGPGVIVGILTVFTSVAFGIIFHIINKKDLPYLSNLTLVIFNFFVNTFVLLLMLLLPGALKSYALYKVGFAFAFVYPIFGLIISKIMQLHISFMDSSIKVRDNQEKYSRIFNNSVNPLLVIDAVNYKILDVNEAFLFLTDYDENDLIGKSLAEINLFNPKDLESFIIPNLLNKKSIKSLEFKIYSKYDREIDVMLNSTEVELNVGLFYLFSFYDLRPQKEAIKEILKLTRVYSLLSEVNQMIVRVKNKDELLKGVCDISQREGNFKLVWIGRLDKNQNKVEVLYSSGSATEYLTKFNIRFDDEETRNYPTVQCFLTGRFQIISNWELDERVKNFSFYTTEYGIKSSAAFPIKVFGNLVYTINFYSDEVNYFDSPEINLLDEVSKDISFALEAIENDEMRRKAEAKLQENLRFLQTLINNLPGFIYRCRNDRSWTMEYLTHQVEEFTGYKSDDFINNRNIEFNDIIHPDYREFLWNKWQELLPKKEVFEFEYPIITKNGEIRWVWERGRGIYNEQDEVVALEGFITDTTDKVLFRQKLIESSEKLKLLVEGTPYFFFYTHDREGRITYISPSVEKITGYSVDEWLGNKEWFLTNNPINEKAKLNTRKVLNGEPGNFPTYIEINHKTGDKIILEIYEVPHYKEDKIVGLHGIARDVTVEKKYQEKLIQSEERFRKLFEEHSAVKLLIDPETRQIVDANNSALKFYGYTLDELKSMKISDINIMGEDYAKRVIHKVLTGEQNYFEFKHRLKDGTIKDVAVFSSPVEFEVKKILYAIIYDITEKKKLEDELFFEKRKFQQLFDNSPFSIAVIDVHGKIQIMNHQFIVFFNLQNVEITGKTFIEICCPEEMEKMHSGFLDKIIKGDKKIQETYLKKRDGSLAFVQFIGVPIFLNAEIVGAFIVIIDLTKIKEAEESLKSAKEMAELASKLKDTFIANISHEIRTPLNAILGYSSLLQENLEHQINEDEKFYFDVIQSAGNRLMRTIDMIMNYSRIVAGDLPLKKELLNLSYMIEELCHEFKYNAQIKNLEFEYNNEVGEVYIYADNYSTTQAIANIIDNAIKYTKQGYVKVKLKRDIENKLVLEVEDTGIGISKKYKERIFEPYTQQELGWNRPYEGVGLGLALVKNYLNLNDMEVTFESEEGKGSIFYIHFKDTEIKT